MQVPNTSINIFAAKGLLYPPPPKGATDWTDCLSELVFFFRRFPSSPLPFFIFGAVIVDIQVKFLWIPTGLTHVGEPRVPGLPGF